MEINRFIYSIIFLAVALSMIFFLVMPKYRESVSLQKELQEKQIRYRDLSLYYDKVSKIVLSLEDRKDVLQKIDSALPFNFSVAPLVYFFHKKGVENGLIVNSINLSYSTPTTSSKDKDKDQNKEKEAEENFLEKKVKSVNFTINILGNYQGLKNFLRSLEKSARLFQVNTVSFSSLSPGQATSSPENESRLYNFKLEMKTYTY